MKVIALLAFSLIHPISSMKSFDEAWMCRIAWPPASGVASIYWEDEFDARGKKFMAREISCAHRTETFGRRLLVTNLEPGKNFGKKILCPVQDRGPYKDGRVLDFSMGAANAIGCSVARGLCKVKVEREGCEE